MVQATGGRNWQLIYPCHNKVLNLDEVAVDDVFSDGGSVQVDLGVGGGLGGSIS
jgi:hypothetical protein